MIHHAALSVEEENHWIVPTLVREILLMFEEEMAVVDVFLLMLMCSLHLVMDVEERIRCVLSMLMEHVFERFPH
jgi:hypothetical protein